MLSDKSKDARQPSKRKRLDQELVKRGITETRSQALNYIQLGRVTVNNKTVTKPAFVVKESDTIKLTSDKYVSRSAHKLESVAKQFKLNFKDKVVLDVGSSTGGFTDYALKHGAKKVIAVDVGSNQMHPKLRLDTRIDLHEKTDIRDFNTSTPPDIILIDVSFISLSKILAHIKKLSGPQTIVLAMAKPQFEADAKLKHKGVVKNSAIRRKVLGDLEQEIKRYFVIKDKADSKVKGSKGNIERFYLLQPVRR